MVNYFATFIQVAFLHSYIDISFIIQDLVLLMDMLSTAYFCVQI